MKCFGKLTGFFFNLSVLPTLNANSLFRLISTSERLNKLHTSQDFCMLITTELNLLHFPVTNFSSAACFPTTVNVFIFLKITFWLSVKRGLGFKIKTAVFTYVLPKLGSEISTKSRTGVERVSENCTCLMLYRLIHLVR